tara:strand:- start:236 stop:511 length:276 start_codon:yes stop_codon:yes gene_type:complete
MKTLIERIKSNIFKLDFDKKPDRALAVYDLRLLIYFITNHLVYDKGRNFNKTLTKIIKIHADLSTTQKCKPYNQAHKEVVEILDKFLIEVA